LSAPPPSRHHPPARSHLSLFFLLPLPPPPRSTLFPYTTLFRFPARCLWYQYSTVKYHILSQVCTRRLCDTCKCAGTCSASLRRSDRKSTRLNSSHVSISYAVFCLKKKNIHAS